MPHDLNGNLLSVGDIVHIPAKVVGVHQTEEFCNLDLEFCILMPGRVNRDRYSQINTKQVIKQGE